jgi:hypothetical protein
MRIAALTALALLALPAVAPANEGMDAEAMVDHIFEVADANGDGVLTADEYEAAGLQGFGVTFEQSDLDGNGETSRDEYRELYHRHHSSGDRVDA